MDIFTHSWRDEPRPKFIWIRKGEPICGVEYLAPKKEIAREGWKANPNYHSSFDGSSSDFKRRFEGESQGDRREED